MEYDIVIVGLGPAGIIAALEASKNTNLKILCIDKGKKITKRKHKTCIEKKVCSCQKSSHCNVINGLGGSSLISGTKFSLFPAGTGLMEIIKDETFLEKKTNEVIDYLKSKINLFKDESKFSHNEAYTFYSKFNYTNKFYKSYSYEEEEYHQFLLDICDVLEKRNVNIKFSTTLNKVIKEDQKIFLEINENKINKKVFSKRLILSTGKSGYDLLSKISNELNLPKTPASLEIGVRLEFPTAIFEDIDMYQSDLKLKSGNSKTYCVSKNGYVVKYNYNGNYFTEGHVKANDKTGFTNLGILIKRPSSINNSFLYDEIIKNYKSVNKGNILKYSYKDFFNNVDICKIFSNDSLDREIKEAVEKFVNAFINEKEHSNINIYLLEQDFPIWKYDVNSKFEILDNIYIIGSATGKFRGIVQCFVSGIICMENILEKIVNEK
ncbi:MAG: FAD-dependent oxidoreductase [Arcobacter sp.]|uniref:FAD-dependent oxidoreductase n=1 Tax=Arcobacter sp. TaxID=1872629 RepID=UPI003D055D54